MKTPVAILDKTIDWREYDVLGFDLEALKRGEYSWWSKFVKAYSRLYVEFYPDCIEAMLTAKDGTTTSLKQLSYNHVQVRMTDRRDILLLISHPSLGRIYTSVKNEDLTRGNWIQLIRCTRPKKQVEVNRPYMRPVKF